MISPAGQEQVFDIFPGVVRCVATDAAGDVFVLHTGDTSELYRYRAGHSRSRQLIASRFVVGTNMSIEADVENAIRMVVPAVITTASPDQIASELSAALAAHRSSFKPEPRPADVFS